MAHDAGSHEASQIPTNPLSSLRERIANIMRPRSSSTLSMFSDDRAYETTQPTSTNNQEPEANDYTPLLGNYDRTNSVCGLDECNHGTFSPRPQPESCSNPYNWEPQSQAAQPFWYNPATMGGLEQGEEPGSTAKRLWRENGMKHQTM